MEKMALHRWTVVVLLAACAPSARPAPGTPVPQPEAAGVAPPAPALPEVPAVDGALRLDVVYPPEGASVTAADSTFVFGSTGSGLTRLAINGAAVEVAPNGAFLAYLPVPADGVYRLNATKGGESAQAERRIQPPPVRASAVALEIVASSVYPTGVIALPRGEVLEVGFRGPRRGQAALRLPDGRRIPLVEDAGGAQPSDAANFQLSTAAGAQAPSPLSTYRGFVAVTMPLVAPRDTMLGPPRLAPADWQRMPASSPVARGEAAAANPVFRPFTTATPAEFELVIAGDTLRQLLPVNLAVLDPSRPRVGVAQAPPDAPSDWTVRGRHDTGGPFHYFWPPGTRLALTGERNGMFRVRLAGDRTAWVPAADVSLLAEGTPRPAGAVGGARMTPFAGWIDLRIPLPERVPFHVEEEASALHVDVFGATSRINFFQYGALDPLVERAEWSQPADDVLRVTVRLTEPVWGYDAFFDGGGALVVRIRRPPRIDPERPLAGLLVALDAGHPPGGAIGPTRLTEAEANLWIARSLRPMLEAAGARVLMIRDNDAAVDLNARPRMARDSNAHVLLSVHNNAFPDGVNPFENNGTSVYYYHPHSVDMAQLFQQQLLAELRLRDIGIGRADLALVRPTWMPAVLTETSFLMVPRQEAALRDAQVQERIARAHFRALEAFLRQRSQER